MKDRRTLYSAGGYFLMDNSIMFKVSLNSESKKIRACATKKSSKF